MIILFSCLSGEGTQSMSAFYFVSSNNITRKGKEFRRFSTIVIFKRTIEKKKPITIYSKGRDLGFVLTACSHGCESEWINMVPKLTCEGPREDLRLDTKLEAASDLNIDLGLGNYWSWQISCRTEAHLHGTHGVSLPEVFGVLNNSALLCRIHFIYNSGITYISLPIEFRTQVKVLTHPPVSFTLPTVIAPTPHSWVFAKTGLVMLQPHAHLALTCHFL